MDDLIRVLFGALLLLIGIYRLARPRAYLDLVPKESIFRRLNPLTAFYYSPAGLIVVRMTGALLAAPGLLLLLV